MRRLTPGKAVVSRNGASASGFTLVEVAIAMAIAAFAIGGILSAYIVAAQRSEWIAASAAAQAQVVRQLESVRAARWDLAWTNELVTANFPDEAVTLDAPETGATPLDATNRTTLSLVSSDPPLMLIRVECIWSLPSRGPFTNTITSYRAPDQ